MPAGDARILTTHAGSLPRPRPLVELLVRRSRHEHVDLTALAQAVEAAVRRVIAHQLEVGIDVGNDGEQGRESFFSGVRREESGLGWTSGSRK